MKFTKIVFYKFCRFYRIQLGKTRLSTLRVHEKFNRNRTCARNRTCPDFRPTMAKLLYITRFSTKEGSGMVRHIAI